MRWLYANTQGEVYLKDVPEPTLEGSGVLIETLASVIGAGSELGGIRRARQAQQEGRDLGPVRERPMSYQSAGRILEVSPDLRDQFQPGDLVAASGGGFAPHAERAFVPKHSFAKLPLGLSPAEAATTNVGLTGLHALRRAQFEPGETAAVIGLGMVGQITAQLVHMVGGRAIGVDLLPFRLQKAKEWGIAATALGDDPDAVAAAVADFTGGVGVDASFVTASGGAEPGRAHGGRPRARLHREPSRRQSPHEGD